MLLDGINHVAIITDDTDRFVRFYEDVFDAKVSHRATIGPGTLTMVDIGPRTELNVFELDGDVPPDLVRGSMFGHA
jgi:catechol 2,3-dioxygenase-like lactoylglutathione lyase family enzyme